MTLLQMQYFIEVCKTGSTLKASQNLNISQSTVSASIKALEEELGVALFQRTSKGMVPNAAGIFFQKQCQEILEKTKALSAEMERFSSIRRPIRLGIPVQLNFMYWSDLYFELKQNFPDVEFKVVNRTVPVLMDMLKKNELDGLIMLRSGQKIEDNYMELRVEHCRYVSMSVSHPLAKEPVVSYRQLIPYPVLMYTDAVLLLELLQESYRSFGAELKYAQQFDQLSTLIQFLRRNAGIAYLHKDITKHYPDLTSIPILEEKGPFVTYLLWSKNGMLARAPKRLFQVFKDFFQNLEDEWKEPIF